MKLLIVSDILGNWPALEAVLRAEPDHDAVAFGGDVVDYGPQPVECLRWLADHADHLVLGNHDNALAFGQDCRCMGSFREATLATPIRAATILGELKTVEAVGPLLALVHHPPDPYVQAAAVEALGRIAGEEVLGTLRALAANGPVLARRQAVAALEKMGREKEDKPS